MRFALLSSTNASVVRKVFALTNRNEFNIDLVISDRNCGALELAKENGIDFFVTESISGIFLSNEILKELDHKEIDYVYVFFTKILCGNLINNYKEKLINFHPSILPACPGLNGFENTISSGALIAGSTVHFIDSGVDTGKIILQTITSTLGKTKSQIRHEIFAQQCASLLDVHMRLLNDSLLFGNAQPQKTINNGFIPGISEKALKIHGQVASCAPPVEHAYTQ
ncbi:Phosphoribosylglycinamide formyltransferase [Thiorhodovibrio winogradskyi]|uniref:phosphoribosylglycinamide formyltransferase 1 n=1 Tax=Thiorhodovibrio winogradskyi TaxID=77007 RepID=A0ABZ0SCW1_9GAMM|nr:formyltransferase family protein [Thiorhodovibrio winogradskyi]